MEVNLPPPLRKLHDVVKHADAERRHECIGGVVGGSGGGAGGDGEVASGARRVDLHRLHVGHVGFCQLWLLGGGRRGEWQSCLGRI